MNVCVTFCASEVSCFSSAGVLKGETDSTGKVLAHVSSLLSWNAVIPHRIINKPRGTHREMAFVIIRSKLRRAFGQRGWQSKPPQVSCKATNLACSAWLPAHLCSCPRAGSLEEAKHWVTARGDRGKDSSRTECESSLICTVGYSGRHSLCSTIDCPISFLPGKHQT